MAPSPALRCSPGRELMSENCHIRGRSFESGLNLKTKDDDLVLFNEMQNQEKDNFLLHTADDFDESLSKLRHFSNFKLGISIPTRGDSRDLLNAEGDKNDYEWLLTPPETPLFQSLDDEYPQPVNLASRGRARSQPITISRSVGDKSYQTSRTSSSPHRLSPSPRSSGTLMQMRGRPSSAPRSSPHPVVRSTTPTRRSSTPPNKQCIPSPRHSTPTLQRESGSSIQSSNYGGREPSLVKASRGNSASPKLQGWQMTLPGFTSETPPNLQTSLLDRPMSHRRGSSSASGNGRESPGRPGRKSMSPTSSRSISSSHCQERDRFSSYSKCSMVSSGDDEESLHSITVGISRSSPVRKDGALASNKTMPFSRKPSRNSPTNCVPKRSFDSALRLMDQRKTPQNMFRPLLSSVPATTFRPIFSRNSSLTTSSNASSEHGVFSVALDVESRELEPTELPVGWERTDDSETHEEVFLFDKVDEIVEDTSHEVLSRKHLRHNAEFVEILSNKFDSDEIQNTMVLVGAETRSTTLELACFTDNHCDMDDHTMLEVCSKCGKTFMIFDVKENRKLCQECAEEDSLCATGLALTCVPFNKNVASQMDTAVGTSGKGLLNTEVSEFHEEEGNIMGADCLPNTCSIQLLDQREFELSNQPVDRQRDINVSWDCSISEPQLSNNAVNPSLKVDIPEGTGISVLLLHRSCSSKWPILQGKSVSATNILCSEPSYSRDNINSFRRSIGKDSASASSSVDLGSSRQTEATIQYQLRRLGEADDIMNDFNSNTQNMSLPDDLSINSYELRHPRSEWEEEISSSTECSGYDSLKEIILVTEEHVDSLNHSNFNAMPSPSLRPVISENYISKHPHSCRTISISDGQILDHQGNNDLSYSSAEKNMYNEDCTSSIHIDECPQNNEGNVRTLEGTTDINGCSEMEKDYTISTCTFQNDDFDATTKSSSIVTIELPHGCSELGDCQTECIPSHNPAYSEQHNGRSICQTSENDVVSCSTSEPSAVTHEHENYVFPREETRRSLTLEEATDTVLFCSSIIHDLAYKAVRIGMEKELKSVPMAEAHQPITELRESWKMSYKHSPRSHKVKRMRMDSQPKSPPKQVDNDLCVHHEFTASSIEIPRKVDTAKPPKLESRCNCTVM